MSSRILFIYSSDEYLLELKSTSFFFDTEFNILDKLSHNEIASKLINQSLLNISKNQNNFLIRNLPHEKDFSGKQKELTERQKELKYIFEHCDAKNILVILKDKPNKLSQDKFKDCATFLVIEGFKPWEIDKAAKYLDENFFNKKNINIKLDALELCIENFGIAKLRDTVNFITSLNTSGEQITTKMIERELIGQFDGKKVINSLVKQDRKSIQRILESAKNNKDPKFEKNMLVLSIMHSELNNFKKLLLAKEIYKNKDELAKVLEVKPGRLYYMMKELGEIKLNTVTKIQNLLTEEEFKLKSGQIQNLSQLIRNLTLEI